MNKNTHLNQNYICPIGADVRQAFYHFRSGPGIRG